MYMFIYTCKQGYQSTNPYPAYENTNNTTIQYNTNLLAYQQNTMPLAIYNTKQYMYNCYTYL